MECKTVAAGVRASPPWVGGAAQEDDFASLDWPSRCRVALLAPHYGRPACFGLVHVASWRAVVGAYGARPLRPALVGETQDGSRLETHTGDGRR